MGKRHVKVTEWRRTHKDWAQAMRELSDIYYPEAEVIVIVMDNFNTHFPTSFYKVFELEEVCRLTNRFEFHHTPKYGNWLNIAKIELSMLSRQCLDRRMPNPAFLECEVKDWKDEPNDQIVKVQ